MNDILLQFLAVSLSGAFIALVIFLLKPLIKNKVTKSFMYYIWAIVLLRLVIPFGYGIELPIAAITPPITEEQSADVSDNNDISDFVSDTVTDEVSDEVSDALSQPSDEYSDTPSEIPDDESESPVIPPDDISTPDVSYPEISLPDNSIPPFSGGTDDQNPSNSQNGASDTPKTDFWKMISDNLFYIWLAGTAISIAWYVIAYAVFVRRIRKSFTPPCEADTEIFRELCGNRRVRLVCSDIISTPMLMGVINPVIVLPRGDYSKNGNQAMLRYILMHELTHYSRQDIVYKWATVLVTSLHWFNPVVYFVKREIANACELSCDEAVIKTLNADERKAYGNTLITLASKREIRAWGMAATLCESKKQLKGRLVNIMKYRKRTIPAIAFMLALALILGGCAIGVADFNSSSDDTSSPGSNESSVPEYQLPEDITEAKFEDVINYMVKEADELLHSGETVTVFDFADDYLISLCGPAAFERDGYLCVDTSTLDKSDLKSYVLAQESSAYDNIRFLIVTRMLLEYYDNYCHSYRIMSNSGIWSICILPHDEPSDCDPITTCVCSFWRDDGAMLMVGGLADHSIRTNIFPLRSKRIHIKIANENTEDLYEKAVERSTGIPNYIPPLTDYENLPGPYSDPITFDSFEEIKELNSMITADDETLAAYLKESNPGPVWLKSREDIIALFDEFGIYETIFISEDTGYKLTSVTFDTYRANIYYTYEKEGVAEIKISYCGKWQANLALYEDKRSTYMKWAYINSDYEPLSTVSAGKYEIDMYKYNAEGEKTNIIGCVETDYIYTAIEYTSLNDSDTFDLSWQDGMTADTFNGLCGYTPTAPPPEYTMLHITKRLDNISSMRNMYLYESEYECYLSAQEWKVPHSISNGFAVTGDGTCTKVGVKHLFSNVGDLDFMLIENYKFEKLTANAYDPMITVEYHSGTKNLNITSYSKTAHPEIGESNEFDERSPEHTFMIGDYSAEMYSVEAAEGIAFKSNVIETDTAYIIIEFFDKNSEDEFDDSWCSAAVLTTMNTVDVDQFPY